MSHRKNTEVVPTDAIDETTIAAEGQEEMPETVEISKVELVKILFSQNKKKAIITGAILAVTTAAAITLAIARNVDSDEAETEDNVDSYDETPELTQE
jgi:hypothetical protein